MLLDSVAVIMVMVIVMAVTNKKVDMEQQRNGDRYSNLNVTNFVLSIS